MKTSEERLFYLAFGPGAALFLGWAMTPLRDWAVPTAFLFPFIIVGVIAGEFGGYPAALATALTSTFSLDFFLMQPYLQLSISLKHDITSFLGLAACGVVAAAIADRRSASNSVGGERRSGPGVGNRAREDESTNYRTMP